jgi:hypothetical protein
MSLSVERSGDTDGGVAAAGVAGYRHPAYARALEEFGRPLHLPGCDGWLLERPIVGRAATDATGCYPLFGCGDWSRLPADLDALAGRLVSVVLVTDPFGAFRPEDLAPAFDRFSPFKEHLVVDLGLPPGSTVSTHHRRNIRKASRVIEVERCDQPLDHLADWVALYANLITRHGIGGVARFSEASFAAQLRVPGLTMLRAVHRGETVGMTLWYLQDSVAYYHLGSYSDAGYELGASFPLFAFAIESYSREAAWLSLGAGAGLDGSADDGLTRFKRGWSSGSRTAYLAGRILDAGAYDDFVRSSGMAPDPYFPLYRKGEFA